MRHVASIVRQLEEMRRSAEAPLRIRWIRTNTDHLTALLVRSNIVSIAAFALEMGVRSLTLRTPSGKMATIEVEKVSD